MRHFFTSFSLRSVACAGLVALVGFSGTSASAGYQSNYQPSYGVALSPYQPDDHCDHCQRPAYYYKEITVYEPRQVPDVQWITKYDHCGKPYQVKIVTIRTIQVPVRQRIKVAY